ncbi:MAG: DNA polymerase [Candidatus Actinomarina sp.]|jgi:DNA polymerase-1|nr:DNA polymerase [Candidatus Actinomarina sp.]NND23799.1 DNA polymerase I [Acidimicrobiia bacterium]|tara:strand:+ start:7970 stop:10471 length:2502 start_codon:yes stop_codon:yes gene_type:complete
MIVLVDGFSIAFRAFYALPETLMTSKGTPTNVIHGFMSMLNKITSDYKLNQLIVTWDLPGQTFRNEIYTEYKANRTSAPDNFNLQIPLLQSLLKTFNIPQVSKEGYEADDVLGSLSKSLNSDKKKVLIVTGDRDTFQLISKKTNILYTKRGISDVDLVDEKFFVEKFGIKTSQYVEYLALKGDPSDNIPGLPGVGQKTATTLLQEYQNIDNIYKNLDDLTPKIKSSFEENKELLLMSKELATIKTDIELDIPDTQITDTIFKSESVLQDSQEQVSELELNKYIRQYKTQQEDMTPSPKNTKLVDITKQNMPQKSIIFEYEGDIYTVSEGIAGKLIDHDVENKEFISLTTQNIYKINPNLSDNNFIAYDCLVFLHEPNKRPDTLLNICKHIEQANLLTKKSSLDEYINFISINYKKVVAEIKEFNNDKDLMKLYKDLDYPIASVLNLMHTKGVKVSNKKIELVSKFINTEISTFTKKIFQITEQEFNLNSPKQLAKVLFEDMKLPVIKKTPKGAPSTDGSVLDELSKEYEVANYILKYREYEKIRSTYIDGLKSEITSDNRIHTTYNLFGTTTGRLSSEKPNLQNIPNKTDIGQKIREFFIADNNHEFIISDYSQIELRVLAHLSSDTNMINILKSQDADIHTETASRIFDVKIESVTKDMRRKAKEVNFGLIYGMEAFGLSKSLNVSKKEAQDLIDSYFAQFPKIKGYLDRIVSDAEKNGYTKTLYGRKRYIKELSSSNFQLKAMGKRIAMNAPIQGTAADIMKIAMLGVQEKTLKYESTNLILQIHDEIIVQTPKESSKEVMKIVKTEMESASKLKVPLFVNIKASKDLSNN